MRRMIVAVSCLLLCAGPITARAQGKLDKKISLSIRRLSLTRALEEIGRKGGFFFSYNTNILSGDSIVDVSAEARPLRQVLEKLLGGNYEFQESGRYIIILRKATGPPARIITVSGSVYDKETGELLNDVSLYESDQLVSALTDTNGFFRLRLKERNTGTTLVVSKQLYRDTVVYLAPGPDREFRLAIVREQVAELTPFTVTNRVEKTWLGKFFLSSRAIVQSMNLMNFFADKPVQFSLTPGLGTHGHMGSQVINKFSLNVLGGYTAGINGLEVAGIFNIDKKEVRYVQAAGIFNVAGGNVRGLQVAGIYNQDLDSVKGLQAAGLVNKVKGSFSGVQAAGLVNITEGDLKGVQCSGILNRAGHLKGVQVGLVNIADTSSGYMIGLINIVRNGRRRISLSTNELLPFTLSYKTGSRKFYSILLAGADLFRNGQVYALGFGFGREWPLTRTLPGQRSRLSFSLEGTIHSFYLGTWKDIPNLYRLEPSLQLMLGQKLSLFTGPAISLFYPKRFSAGEGYRSGLPNGDYPSFSAGGNGLAWLGWHLGVNFF